MSERIVEITAWAFSGAIGTLILCWIGRALTRIRWKAILSRFLSRIDKEYAEFLAGKETCQIIKRHILDHAISDTNAPLPMNCVTGKHLCPTCMKNDVVNDLTEDKILKLRYVCPIGHAVNMRMAIGGAGHRGRILTQDNSKPS